MNVASDMKIRRLPMSHAERRNGNGRAANRDRGLARAIRHFSREISRILDEYMTQTVQAAVANPAAMADIFTRAEAELTMLRAQESRIGMAFGARQAKRTAAVPVRRSVRLERNKAAGKAIGKAANVTGTEFSDLKVLDRRSVSIADWLRSLTRGTLTRIQQQTFDRRDELLEASIEEQLTPAQIARQLLAEGIAANKSDAERMAHTDFMWAANEGEMQQYRELGYELVQWLATDDDLLCPFCSAMDGGIIEIGSPFASQGTPLEVTDLDTGKDYRSNTKADIFHPPLHPNCRCTTVPVEGTIRDNKVIEPGRPEPGSGEPPAGIETGPIEPALEPMPTSEPVAPEDEPFVEFGEVEGYKTFASREAALEYGEEALVPLTESAMDGDEEVFELYTDNSYAINEVLGNALEDADAIKEYLGLDEESAEQIFDVIDTMTRDIESGSLPEPIVSYRGTPLHNIGVKNFDDLHIGQKLKPIPTFVSSSLSPKIAEDYAGGGVVLRILHPKGAPAIYLEGMTTAADQLEILNAPGLRLEVVSLSEIRGYRVITARQIIEGVSIYKRLNAIKKNCYFAPGWMKRLSDRLREWKVSRVQS